MAESGRKCTKVADSPNIASVEPPRGTFQARVDEKGRLKLPAVFQQYLKELGEEKVFVTSLDGRTGRLYPISIWKQNEIAFERAAEESEAAEDLALLANYFGEDSDVDPSGRVLVPTTLRRHLKIEGESVFLDCAKGRINLYGSSEFEARRLKALEGVDEKLKKLTRLGLK